MNAYCYIDYRIHQEHRQDQEKILSRWRDSFSRGGFQPFILTEHDAMGHPDYESTLELVNSFPTVNNREYENACWLRWLAYYLNAPGLFTDWDVINFSMKPELVPVGNFISLCNPPNPGAVYATQIGIEFFIESFPEVMNHLQTIKGKPHASDLVLFEKMAFRGRSYCGTASLPDAWKLPMVHFCNVDLPSHHRHHKRWMAMDSFAHEL